MLHHASGSDAPFRHMIVDPSNPRDPHGKAAGDLDGDGNLDIVAHHQSSFGRMRGNEIHRR